MFIKAYNEKLIRWREDGFGCLTDMGKATGKNVSDWLRLKGTKEYIDVLSSILQIPATGILQAVHGGSPEKQGTWGNKQLCIRFAQWCSPEFAVQVDLWVEEIMTKGFIDIRNLTPSEIILAQAQRIVDIEREQKALEREVQNIHLNQIAAQEKIHSIDETLDDLSERNAALEAEMGRVINPYGSYYTVMGFNNRRQLGDLPCSKAANLGKKASQICRERDIPIEKVNDPRFGIINSYPEEVLEEVYGIS